MKGGGGGHLYLLIARDDPYLAQLTQEDSKTGFGIVKLNCAPSESWPGNWYFYLPNGFILVPPLSADKISNHCTGVHTLSVHAGLPNYLFT